MGIPALHWRASKTFDRRALCWRDCFAGATQSRNGAPRRAAGMGHGECPERLMKTAVTAFTMAGNQSSPVQHGGRTNATHLAANASRCADVGLLEGAACSSRCP